MREWAKRDERTHKKDSRERIENREQRERREEGVEIGDDKRKE
jgi:hypothetical protein